MSHPIARSLAFVALLMAVIALAHSIDKAIANTAYLAALAEVSRS